MSPFLRFLLMPFALLWGALVWLRNKTYDWGWFKSLEFEVPVISVGNLSMGGTGKTPHVEYLINLLKNHLQIATLSRGYKRKTRGFLLAELNSTAEQIGDEPRIYKQKYPFLTVAVGEERALAIPEILMHRPNTQLVLLDDAFQHRSVKPGLNILLTRYDEPFSEDFIFPAGGLREFRKGSHRADAIIVTSCPEPQDFEETKEWAKEFDLQANQSLYFSYYKYHKPYSFFDNTYTKDLSKDLDVIVLCAIANPDRLEAYLEDRVGHLKMVEYADHYFFLDHDIDDLIIEYKQLDSNNKVVITTEKDAMRLIKYAPKFQEAGIPLFCLPIEVKFWGEGSLRFEQQVMHYLESNLK